MTYTLIVSDRKLRLRTHETFNGAEYDTIATNLDDDTIHDICHNNGLSHDNNNLLSPAFMINGNTLSLYKRNGEKITLCSDLRKCYVSNHAFSEAVKYPVDRR